MKKILIMLVLYCFCLGTAANIEKYVRNQYKIEDAAIYRSLRANAHDVVLEYGVKKRPKYTDYIGRTNGELTAIIQDNKDYFHERTVDNNLVVYGKNEIDYFNLGEVTVNAVVSVRNSRNEKIERNFPINVSIVDTQAPIIELKKESISVYQGTKSGVYDNISRVYDVIDGDISTGDENTPNSYWYKTDYKDEIGNYTITVCAMDINGNVSEKSYSVSVEKRPVYYPSEYNGYWGLGGTQGNYGKLSVPSLNISVPLNFARSGLQSVVNWNNSALITDIYACRTAIFDHYYQNNFGNFRNCSVGTTMYIRHGNSVKAYVCVGVYRWCYKDWGGGSTIGGVLALNRTDLGQVAIQTCEGSTKYNCYVYFNEK